MRSPLIIGASRVAHASAPEWTLYWQIYFMERPALLSAGRLWDLPIDSLRYFGVSVTGTSMMLSTGSLLSNAALRMAASLGPSYIQKVLVSSAFA